MYTFDNTDADGNSKLTLKLTLSFYSILITLNNKCI